MPKDHSDKLDYSYIDDYYESRGYDAARKCVKKIELGANEIGDCSARLNDNKLEVTVASCERTILSYIFTLSIIGAYGELVEISLCNGDDIYIYIYIIETLLKLSRKGKNGRRKVKQ